MKKFPIPKGVKNKKQWVMGVRTLLKQRAFQLCRENRGDEEWERCVRQAEREFEQGQLGWFMPDSVAMLASALERSLGRV